MQKCADCNGFIPAHVVACPNCQKSGSRVLKACASVMGVGMLSLTLMACYGAPPDFDRPRQDPEDTCKDPGCDKDGNNNEQGDKNIAEPVQ